MKVTVVVELPDDQKTTQEKIDEIRSGEGIVVYGFKRDAVADVRNILANSGTPERLDLAVKRAAQWWW